MLLNIRELIQGQRKTLKRYITAHSTDSDPHFNFDFTSNSNNRSVEYWQINTSKKEQTRKQNIL